MHFDVSNPSDQPKLVWPASFVVARAYLDQLVRKNGLASDKSSHIASELDHAQQMSGNDRHDALKKLAKEVDHDAKNAVDPIRVKWLANAIKALADAKS